MTHKMSSCMEFPLLVAILSLSFLAGFWLFVLFWFVLPMMGLLTGLCVGPLPALLRLPTNLTALQANYNSAFLLRLNVCNDLAKAKALDGKKYSLRTWMKAPFRSTANHSSECFPAWCQMRRSPAGLRFACFPDDTKLAAIAALSELVIC